MSEEQTRAGDDSQAEEMSVDQEIAGMEADSAAAEHSASDLARLLQEAQTKADQHYEQLVRAHAELENLKRRHSRELENAHKYALDKFVSELLGVWDSLELGLQAAEDDNGDIAKLREGTDLTLKMLVSAMNKFGVEQVAPEGQPFNPEFHQAMAMLPREDVPANTVVAVMQKGYSLNGRLVRPAMVVVSQGGTQAGVDTQA